MRSLAHISLLPNVKVVQVEEEGGAFYVWNGHRAFKVIASHGMNWDHVSVSTRERCPTWDEMEFIKRMFFNDDEVAMQLHVAPSDHINCHPYCLHLWRPQDKEIPL